MNREAIQAKIEEMKPQMQQALETYHGLSGAISALEWVLKGMPEELAAIVETEEVN